MFPCVLPVLMPCMWSCPGWLYASPRVPGSACVRPVCFRVCCLSWCLVYGRVPAGGSSLLFAMRAWCAFLPLSLRTRVAGFSEPFMA